jgi:Leucine rich repeat
MKEQNHTVIEWMPSFSVFNEPEKENSMEDKVDQYLPYASLPSRDEQEPEHSSTWKKVMEENPLRWMPSFSAFDDSNKLQSEAPGPMENQSITWNPSFSVFNNHSVSELEELRNTEGVLRHPSAYLTTNALRLNRAREVSVIDNTEESCIDITASDEEMDIQAISQMPKESPLGDKQTKRQRDCSFAITETVEGHEISFAQLYYGVEYDQKKAIKEYVCQNMTLDTQNSAEVNDSIEGDKAIGDRETASCGVRYRIIFMIFGVMVILLAVIIGALKGVRRNPMSVQQNPSAAPTQIRKNNTASTPISTENSSKLQGNGEIEGSISSPTINDHLLKILSPISSSKLENEDSPQSIAALSLSNEVEKYNSQYLSKNQDAIIQRFILLILVFSLSKEKPSWIELNECSWNFTTCTSEGIIESLKMVNMNLSGKIPHEISYLSHLTTLDMSSNNLKGSLPDDLFSMRSLKHLYLDKNQLTGSLSPSIGSMTKLESLFLGENEFTGPIPETLPSSLRESIVREHVCVT